MQDRIATRTTYKSEKERVENRRWWELLAATTFSVSVTAMIALSLTRSLPFTLPLFVSTSVLVFVISVAAAVFAPSR